MLRFITVIICLCIFTSLSMGYIVPDIKEVRICAYIDYSGILTINDDGIYVEVAVKAQML